jgi:hypothetical protein
MSLGFDKLGTVTVRFATEMDFLGDQGALSNPEFKTYELAE